MQALWVIITLFLWLAPMRMSTHQCTHVKRMIPLYKVHRVRAHTHTHKHTYTSILHRKPQWLGHGKADVLMVLTNGTWRCGDEPVAPKICKPPHTSFPSPWPACVAWGFQGEATVPVVSALMGEGQKVRGGWRGGVTVMLSPDALWSADCWSAPPSGLCWCSRRRHYCCRCHGNRAARSWQSLQALG